MFLTIILVILTANFILDQTLAYLNLSHLKSTIPSALKGIYEDDKYWKDLIANQRAVADYFEKISVRLIIQESDGFAYIYQPETNPDADDNVKLPRLVRKTPISYEVTLLSVLLREMLEEFDLKEIDQVKFYITNREIKEKIELFF